ncbi:MULTISPECIES: bifunctional ADP-dependent NAD(P)H-hydrate dehydratase/NAD(P)H-hydrate epimerase [Brevibacterium]|uniref:Bifunctional NAD(P)H-hydrate repair enzyme n=1 Tax=Brevibacterium casei TaxID=33889 RepID=A0A7T3ZZ96_9MICO|nr:MULTISPECIES: bifunctional ADP-dependent NAD(P)H-hydrate dehydratase/NAD(P)H-hydrate epimerase [Brevibacterium]QQB14320.1 bifunctional ADP-dependent NAD(P)H-hydrate dehydratase/NAD(P)H-hydrate epimerase [Brevibacterium casei]
MSTFAYPSQVIRDAEVPLLEAGVPLMARAAGALARYAAQTLRSTRGQIAGSRVCVLAGPGNNAGDALFAAASLARRGALVDVITLFDRTHAEGLTAAQRAGAAVLAAGETAHAEALTALDRADLVLDGILGTGGRRGLPDSVTALIRNWRAGDPTGSVIAVDVPSDLDTSADSAPDSRIHADATLTFGGLKADLVDPRAAAFTGAVDVVDIGLDLDPAEAVAEVLDIGDLIAEFPRPVAADHKYSRGVLGVVAGSAMYPGAGVLTSGAAVNTAAGMVRYLGDGEVGDRILDRHAEVVLAAGRIDALVVGSGDPEQGFVEAALGAIAETTVPLVLDAGALDLVGHDEPDANRPVVLTPHAGELSRLLSRLLGEIITSRRVAADPLHWARKAAAVTGHVVLLKGAQTVIACPDGFAVLPSPGPASLATAGSGDVLTGIIGTLLAAAQAERRTRGEDGPMPARAAAHTAGLGVLLHNAAGELSINAEQLVTATGTVTTALVHGDGILVQ